MPSKVMRVDKEFKDYVDVVKEITGMKSDTEVTKRIAIVRPLGPQKPLGQSIDDLFVHFGFIPKRRGK